MQIFAISNRNGTKAIFQDPLAPIAKEIQKTGIFRQHVLLTCALSGCDYVDDFFLGESPRNFGHHVASGFHRGLDHPPAERIPGEQHADDRGDARQRRDQRGRNARVIAIRGGVFIALILVFPKVALLYAIAYMLMMSILKREFEAASNK